MTNFQKTLHRRIVQAMIDTVQEYAPQCAETDKKLYLEVKEYLEEAQRGLILGCAFCPTNAQFVQNLSEEL